MVFYKRLKPLEFLEKLLFILPEIYPCIPGKIIYEGDIIQGSTK
jgi:hypothetical protein